MKINFSTDKPIFLQLAEIIKSDIISGKFRTSEKLPSVRDFALTYSVNPNTVQKALQILEDDKLITTDRTNGKFVANNTKQIDLQKTKLIKQEVDLFFKKLTSLGITENEIKNLVNNKGE